jgi:CO/xanthine dehydrogenase Mo-binding subunit
VPYHVPAYEIVAKTVYTNALPGAHVRAPSDLQVFFAWEQHVDMIAQGLEIDAIDLRLRNVLGDGQTALNGEVLREVNAGRVLETLRRESRYGEPLPDGRGRGIALTCRHTGGMKASIKLTLSASGRIEVVTGATEQGGGQHTLLQRVAAATLGVRPERIAVRRASTGEALDDPGTGGGWGTHVFGRVVAQAATDLKAELEQRSAMALQADCFVAPDGSVATFETVASTLCRDGTVEVAATYDGRHAPGHPSDFSFIAYAI